MQFEIVNPCVDSRWDGWVREHRSATIFHSAEWAKILLEVYRYPLHYGVLNSGGHIDGLLPVTEVSSIFTGRRGVSLPFSDECSPLLGDATLEALVEPMSEFGRRRGWNYLELRAAGRSVPGAVRSDEYVGHELELDGCEEFQFSRLKPAVRRSIRKARRQGIEVERFDSRQAIDTYYSLHCLTRRRHGLPPQPRKFFDAIHKHVLSSGNGFVLLARFEEQWVAGAVFLHFGSNAVFKFGASRPEIRRLRANNLLLWEGIREAREAGAARFSFGRTDVRNSGLLRYKRGWGARELPLLYSRIALAGGARQRRLTGPRRLASASRVIRMTPVPVLRLLGSLAYRHIG